MKQLYQTILQEWWQRPLPQIIPREIDVASLLTPTSIRKVITLTGFRRTGKTFLLLDLATKLSQKNCIYLNFEDERIPPETASLTALSDVLAESSANQQLVLLLDEIQNIPNWSQWVRRLNETTQYQIVLTGSSSKLSSRELPTELRGRSLPIQVNSLNFREFARFKNIDFQTETKQAQIRYLREFLMYGGLPEIVLADEGKKYLLLDEYLQTFVRRDILDRYHIRVEEEFSALLNLLMNSTEYTISKLDHTLRSLGYPLAKTTISRYIRYLEQSYFLHSLYIHHASVKDRMQSAKKCYFVDSFFVTRSTANFSQALGRLMEHKVFEKLSSDSLYYWRNQSRYEVDFVIRQGEKVDQLIQVSYITHEGVIPDREIRNLVLAAKDLNCSNLTMVTWDRAEQIERDGFVIQLVPLADFLLQLSLTAK